MKGEHPVDAREGGEPDAAAAALADRIMAVTLNATDGNQRNEEDDDDDDWGNDDDGEEGGEEEEEEVVEMSEAQLLALLDAQQDPMVVARRLFHGPLPPASEELRHLSTRNFQELRERGWSVVDQAMPSEAVARLHTFALAQLAANELIDASQCMRESGFDETSRTDHIRWFNFSGRAMPEADPSVVEPLRLLSEIAQELAKGIKLRLRRTEAQLAVYPGGTSIGYDRHRDAFPDDGSGDADDEGENEGSELSGQRRVTMILYANPSWKEGDGGHLRIYTPREALVEPVGGRILIFFSGVVDHEVQPSVSPRVALTLWLR